MDMTLILVAVIIAGAAIVAALLMRQGGRAQGNDDSGMAEIKGQLAQLTAALNEQSKTTGEKLGDLRTRLEIIDRAQESLKELSEQTTDLKNVLANKQARGAYGEMQLENLVKQILPPNAYHFQRPLSNGARPDCSLVIPDSEELLVVDAKFPLEAWKELGDAKNDEARKLAGRKFEAALAKHIDDIAGKYIIPGETAESAMMFLPSEAVYAELHTNFGKVVSRSFEKRVYIVSPTTMMANLHTARAMLRDVKMREHAADIQREVGELYKDIIRLDSRVDKLDTHFRQVRDDVEQIKITTGKISTRRNKIQSIEVGEKNTGDADTGADGKSLTN